MTEPVNILMVDDQPEGLLAMEGVLADLGQNLVRASSGVQALAELLQRDFALILLDVQMPGMDGYETAELIRARPRTAGVPIIFLTAIQRSEEFALRGYEAGAVDYLFKPFDPRVLRSKVRVFVDLAQRTTEVKRLNAELEARVAQLTALNEDLDSFAHSASHDLKAPLRAITGFGTLLLEEAGPTLSPSSREHLDRVMAAARRMDRLIQDLLALTQVTHRELVRTPVDLTALARAAAEELRHGEARPEVELVVADGLRADADPGLARLLLDNLLANAWKYTRKCPATRIEVGAAAWEDGGPCCFVCDNGAGFDARRAQADGRLFHPFQRFHAASEFEGTGIGLATVQRVVARHGGRLTVRSAPGEGAEFRFSFGA